MKACQSEIISRERNLGRKRESERRRRRLKGSATQLRNKTWSNKYRKVI